VKTVGVGVVGAGWMGHVHSRAYARLPHHYPDLGVRPRLVAIADPVQDLREDAGSGRRYLPAEGRRRFGLVAAAGQGGPLVLAAVASGTSSAGADTNGDTRARGRNGNGSAPGAADASRLSALVRFEAERARQWFDRGIALAGLVDRRSAACVLAMAGIYERLLERIAADPERALARRVALAPWEKAWVAASSMLASEARTRRRRAGAGEAIGGRR